jgi:dihydrofolate reductase
MTVGTVFLEMSMSLDGFVAGAAVSVERPMGDDRGRIHDWMFKGKTNRAAEAWEEEQFADIGAIIMGNTTFEVGVGPWSDNPTFHAPCFVISHEARENDRQGRWHV